MRAFITGSHAYGTPDESSDIDLVVHLTTEDYDKQAKEADNQDEIHNMNNPPRSPEGHYRYASCLRFGNLNLICCLDTTQWQIWKAGTRELEQRAKRRPVTREEAKRFFKNLRAGRR